MNLTTRYPIILASRSPRRKYLLRQAGLVFRVVPARFDESSAPLLPPEEYVRMLAREKAIEVARSHPDSWVIGADTIVVSGDRILGKPDSPAAARWMLELLSDRTHQVYTAFSLILVAENREITRSVVTDVRFKALTDAEIQWYIETQEPFDKAGAYALQGIGAGMIRSVFGSYTNVIGLPVCELMETLREAGVIALEP
jgi:septum formation protein